MVNFKKFKKTH